MKIVVKCEVSETFDVKTITLEDLGISEEDCNSPQYTEDVKDEAIQDYLNGLSEQPYWVAESFKEIF